jgi:hypothetical protein
MFWELAERYGITRRDIRGLMDLSVLSPQLVDAILQGWQPVELTAMSGSPVDIHADLGRPVCC